MPELAGDRRAFIREPWRFPAGSDRQAQGSGHPEPLDAPATAAADGVRPAAGALYLVDEGWIIKGATRLHPGGLQEELLAILREILERNARAERLAYSPDEAAELLGVSRECVHDLLRTGQLGSVKAERRRLIGKRHLDAFLAGEPNREIRADCQVPASRKRRTNHDQGR